MLISQMMLIGFILYWLSGQFRSEKERLRRDLNATYKASTEIVMDSLLLKNYIKPALGDSALALYNLSEPRAAIMMTDSVVFSTGGDTVMTHGLGSNSIVRIDLTAGNDSGSLSQKELNTLEREMLLRSVKLVIQHVDDSSAVHLRSMQHVGMELDSAIFISEFEARLEDEGLGMTPVWVSSGKMEEKTFSDNRFIIVGGWNSLLPSVEVGNYRSYLFGKILPQTLFALILILLTASAFFLAYTSMRKQAVLNEMRNSFISNISHELKTPVSTVKVALEAMRNFDIKNDRALSLEYMEMASKEIKRLELLITKVLDNSIIEQESSVIRPQRLDLEELIALSLESMRPRLDQRGADVKFSFEESVMVLADPIYMQGVLTNLLDNSLKYGNGNPEVKIELTVDNGNAVIRFSDNGPGIPDQYLKRVFDKFFRVPTDDIHNVKGYGLGLSFVYLIIRMHNGTIDVKNNKSGCTFTIRIPKLKD